MKIVALCFLSSLIALPSYGVDRLGRLGVGLSEQIVSGIPTVSIKLQKNPSSALGGLFGIDSSDDASTFALGIKYYQLIYEEPQLNFYSSFTAAIFSYEDKADEKTQGGHQLDGLFGSEFSFQGLESIGFSFEFGVSIYKYKDNTHISTQGNHLIRSAVHFYL